MITQQEVLTKLYAGQELNKYDIKFLLWEIAVHVDTIEGESHRWTRDVSTIVHLPETPDSNTYSEVLWCIDYEKGLTENQEDEYFQQPYRVEARTKTITKTVYERI